jgi:threonine synthase
MIDVIYDLAKVHLAESDNAYRRFADLLPLGAEARNDLPEEPATPLVHAKALGGKLGTASLYLKNETVLPTKSTKDRMAAVALAYLHACGVRNFCASSTGNSSTAFAYAIPAYPDMHLFLFTAELFVPRVQHARHGQVTHFGMRDATFVEAGTTAAAYASRHGLEAEGGFFNPGRREGLKLAFFEACDQCPRPIDWYVQAVSSAMGVYGVHKGARELMALGRIGHIPRLLCVQQDSCAPMVRAHEAGSDAIRPGDCVARPAGIAEAILRGDPTRAYPHVRRAVLESRGTFASVSETEIRAARRDVAELEGIDVCFSAATAVAGLIRKVRAGQVPRDDAVVVNLTGADRAPEIAPDVTWKEKGRLF